MIALADNIIKEEQGNTKIAAIPSLENKPVEPTPKKSDKIPFFNAVQNPKEKDKDDSNNDNVRECSDGNLQNKAHQLGS